MSNTTSDNIKSNDLPPIDYDSHTGTPVFIQGTSPPSNNESLNNQSFFDGGLIFKWDRNAENIYWLQFIDPDTLLQTWQQFPSDIDNLCYIGILPVLQKLYWLTANRAPTSNEQLNPFFYDGTYGMYWWDLTAGNIYKMTSYDANAGTQVWEQLV